jgi:hypothetical protein
MSPIQCLVLHLTGVMSLFIAAIYLLLQLELRNPQIQLVDSKQLFFFIPGFLLIFLAFIFAKQLGSK